METDAGCHVCPSNAQLKCEVKGKNVRDAYAQCEYDSGVLSSGIDFQCPINDNTVECNWGYIRQQLPADNDRCAYYATYSILNDWIPNID
ncbi:hypothetical protein QBZ16_001663 [Prototheca wickerhamii]|uniref:Uncharacterized protein n=1 Tax=Prototheca wickerhamii TaxID=3111 RepID=A0AAD9MIS3_PROWI|nr:hypothetical protein QBZ16_001663 [Prototheca wickerhamii]